MYTKRNSIDCWNVSFNTAFFLLTFITYCIYLNKYIKNERSHYEYCRASTYIMACTFLYLSWLSGPFPPSGEAWSLSACGCRARPPQGEAVVGISFNLPRSGLTVPPGPCHQPPSTLGAHSHCSTYVLK